MLVGVWGSSLGFWCLGLQEAKVTLLNIYRQYETYRRPTRCMESTVGFGNLGFGRFGFRVEVCRDQGVGFGVQGFEFRVLV